MPSNPVLFLIHGAWAVPDIYTIPLTAPLAAAGIDLLVPRLPTVGADSAGKTLHDDVAYVRAMISQLAGAGREIVVVSHSYGGLVACGGVLGLGKKGEIAGGEKGGGVVGLVFMSALIAPAKGVDVLTLLGGQYAPIMKGAEPYSKNSLITLDTDGTDWHATFFHDVPLPEAEKIAAILEPHSQDALETPVDVVVSDVAAKDGGVKLWYVVCEQDRGLPRDAQEQMAAAVPGMRVERLDSSHAPFASMPEEMVAVLTKIVREAVGSN